MPLTSDDALEKPEALWRLAPLALRPRLPPLTLCPRLLRERDRPYSGKGAGRAWERKRVPKLISASGDRIVLGSRAGIAAEGAAPPSPPSTRAAPGFACEVSGLRLTGTPPGTKLGVGPWE